MGEEEPSPEWGAVAPCHRALLARQHPDMLGMTLLHHPLQVGLRSRIPRSYTSRNQQAGTACSPDSLLLLLLPLWSVQLQPLLTHPFAHSLTAWKTGTVLRRSLQTHTVPELEVHRWGRRLMGWHRLQQERLLLRVQRVPLWLLLL